MQLLTVFVNINIVQFPARYDYYIDIVAFADVGYFYIIGYEIGIVNMKQKKEEI